MSAAQTLPYLRASDDRVRCSEWHLGDASTGGLLGDHVPGWDTNTDTILERRLRVDVDGLREDCRLPGDAPLRLVVTWHSGSTQTKGVEVVSELPQTGTLEVDANVKLVGARLGGRVELTTSVVLVARLPKAPIRAFLPGTVLWESTKTVRVEGSGSRFPMEALPFSTASHRLPSGAAWHLELDPDGLDLPVLGSVVLYLNQEHPAVQRMVAEPNDPVSRMLESMLRFDVASQLVRSALASEEFRNRADPWPSDSVGRVMQKLLQSRFRRDSIDALSRQMCDEPAEFSSLLQARLGLGEMEA